MTFNNSLNYGRRAKCARNMLTLDLVHKIKHNDTNASLMLLNEFAADIARRAGYEVTFDDRGNAIYRVCKDNVLKLQIRLLEAINHLDEHKVNEMAKNWDSYKNKKNSRKRKFNRSSGSRKNQNFPCKGTYSR